jgi:NADH-quinone oxidoreductase subunit M
MTIPWLSLIVFFPLAAAAVTALLPARREGLIKAWATLAALAEVAIALPLWWRLEPRAAGWQFAENRSWLPAFGASYSLGVDGVSVLLVLMTVVLTAIAVVGAYSAVEKRSREFYACLLALEAGMLGTFLATDLLLFYVFWEAMLIPMYLLIGVWGGPRRVYAAVKFFIYTMAGSVLMLVAILWLYFLNRSVTGVPTFALDAFYQLPIAPAAQVWLFLAFAVAFAIKVPMFPFHTWLPDAHVEAPTAGSVILAAVLLKMGTYGFVRFAMPLFPQASLQLTPWIVGLAIVGIWYGALVAMVQPDLKKLVAYSSVSHLGFCMLGLYALNTQGFTGSMLQMLNHGVSTGALFLLVGVVYERRHTRLIADFGGLWKPLPVYASIFMVVMLSSIGLPGTNGFVGEFLVLLGAFRANPWWAAFAAVGVILSAVYMLWMFQRVIFGPVTHAENENLKDLSLRERLVFVPILILIFWMGVAPQPFIDRIEPALARTIVLIKARESMNERLVSTPLAGPGMPAARPAAAAAPAAGGVGDGEGGRTDAQEGGQP